MRQRRYIAPWSAVAEIEVNLRVVLDALFTRHPNAKVVTYPFLSPLFLCRDPCLPVFVGAVVYSSNTKRIIPISSSPFLHSSPIVPFLSPSLIKRRYGYDFPGDIQGFITGSLWGSHPEKLSFTTRLLLFLYNILYIFHFHLFSCYVKII